MQKEKVDVLVIGAGPAGCIAGSIINKQGFNVKVVEKEKFPRFVIGESLLPRVMDHLEEAGFMDAIKSAGFQRKNGAKFVRGNEVCDFNFSDQFSKGWNWTWQVPRAEFDQILSKTLASMGVDVEHETAVKNIEFSGTNSLTTVTDKTGKEKQIEARFIVDASGYGRVIPRMFNLDKPSNFEPRKTHFTHFKDLKRPEGTDGNRITVVVHQPRTWIWIIPFSNGITSVGFVADPEFYTGISEDPVERMRSIIAKDPITKERFSDAEMMFQPKSIEGYAISTKQLYGDGFVLCGNATEFLDPIFSSGVTFAMESGNKAGKLVCDTLNGKEVNWPKQYTDHMMQGINTFRSYVAAWYSGDLYDIFFSENPDPEIKKQICSVLAGYVWDLENPFVKKHDKAIASLAKMIRHRKVHH
ncbi:NAD(P)/FAD-dependent oxidoreductase [Aurantibacillus circumpalustris]|uniref:NAD(P)/FAD-dependent oxidoreductase n=1 Tax=Aurantibacillus circumpalustris TaxID=3036359 RepID=UPI00295BAED2|nr:NAD(P)/FAD-dependent oxidoreductase [Aurantibacillus circumpalustris]